jgi:hypothetical protein
LREIVDNEVTLAPHGLPMSIAGLFPLLSRRSFTLWRLVLGIEEYVAPTWAVEAKAME